MQVHGGKLIIVDTQPTFFYLNFVDEDPVKFKINSYRDDQGNGFVYANTNPFARSVRVGKEATVFTARHPDKGRNTTIQDLKTKPCAIKVDSKISSYLSSKKYKTKIDLSTKGDRLDFKLKHVLESDMDEDNDFPDADTVISFYKTY